MKKLVLLMLLSILGIPLVYSYGSLDTARIGLKLNLSETDRVSSFISVSNPDNFSINYSLTPSVEFDNIYFDNNPDLKSIVGQIGSNSTKKHNFTIVIDKKGNYEWFVTATFENGPYRNSLKSIIQVKAEKSSKDLFIYIIMALSFLILILVVLIIIKKKSLYTQED